MAKKEAPKENRFISFVKGVGAGFLVETVKGIYENFLTSLKDYAFKTQKKILEVFFIFFMRLLGIIFVCIALVLLLNELFQLSLGLSFLAIGIIIIIISYGIRIYIDKKDEV
jgi:hypothetical protein